MAADPCTSGNSRSGLELFSLTPHKIAVCHLIQVFALPGQGALSEPFCSIADRNRLGLFLFSVTRACDDFVEPPLCELLNQLKGLGGFADGKSTDWLSQHLTEHLQAFSSSDDLFNFFDKLRGVLSPISGVCHGDDQITLDANSHLGVFLRYSILAFNILTFEGVCHLLTNIGIYCSGTDSAYELPDDGYSSESEAQLSEDVHLHQDNLLPDEFVPEYVSSVVKDNFHMKAPKSLYQLVEDVQVANSTKLYHDDLLSSTAITSPHNESFQSHDHQGMFLRSRMQVYGYLNEQGDLLEKHFNLFPVNSYDSMIKQLQDMAPELHHVKYLQYLNNLHHGDYLASMDNLHCYFDYSAGMHQDSTHHPSFSSSKLALGRYQSALLCLGIMHCHFGHPKQALEALTEAVRISQQNSDHSCLAYTLSAICNLLSEIGVYSSTGIIGSPYSFNSSTGLGMPLSTQQQLLVLLKRSQKRAIDLKLTSLVAFNHLALAKFDLKNVKQPLLSFGPKAPTKFKTTPISVCKQLRVSPFLFSEIGSELLSVPYDCGSFSTAWIRNLPQSRSSSVSARVQGLNDYDEFNFSAQPSPIPGSVLQLAGSSYLTRSTSWELYGSAPLARINALIHLYCYGDAASSAELSLAHVKLIQHLAIFKGYKEAFTSLKLAEERFSSVYKSRIQILKLQLLHERALHKGFIKFSQQICDEFSVLASSVPGVDIDIKVEASLRYARTLLAGKRFDKAASVAHSLFCRCYYYNLHVENATVLLLLAEIHKRSGNATLGLPYALACLSFCESFNLDLLGASATLTIAELWLSLGPSHAKRASTLVDLALPLILGHGGLELRARANITVAKSHLSNPSFSVSADTDFVIGSLRQASKDLEVLEYHEMAAEAFYLLAMVYDTLQEVENREEASSSFKKHIIALESHVDQDELVNGC